MATQKKPSARKRTAKPKPSGPVFASADALVAAATKRVTMPVALPELGLTVEIRNLTTGEYDELVELALREDERGRGMLDQTLLQRLTVIAALEQPKLDPETAIDAIAGWDANVFARLVLAVRGISHIQEGAADAAMSRFPADTTTG